MDNINTELLTNLRVALAHQNLNQSELAERMGISKQSLNAVMTGKDSLVTPRMKRICAKLGLKITIQLEKKNG